MFSEADVAVKDIVDAMPLLQLPTAERSVVFTPGAPLDFYGNGDGKLHANGRELDIKGINWCAPRTKLCSLPTVAEASLTISLASQVRHRGKEPHARGPQ